MPIQKTDMGTGSLFTLFKQIWGRDMGTGSLFTLFNNSFKAHSFSLLA
jgi:hypothetical protein